MAAVSWKRLSWWIVGLALIAALAAPEVARTESSLDLAQSQLHRGHLNSR